MATQRLAKSGHAAIFWPFLAILAIFLEIDTYNLFCPSLLWRVMGKPIFRPIGLKIAILSHKNLYFGHFWPLSQNAHIAKRAPRKSYLLLGFKRYSHAVFSKWHTSPVGISCRSRIFELGLRGGYRWLKVALPPVKPLLATLSHFGNRISKIPLVT